MGRNKGRVARKIEHGAHETEGNEVREGDVGGLLRARRPETDAGHD